MLNSDLHKTYIYILLISLFSCRDCVVYAASALKHNIEGVIEVLSDSIWRSNLTEIEV